MPGATPVTAVITVN